MTTIIILLCLFLFSMLFSFKRQENFKPYNTSDVLSTNPTQQDEFKKLFDIFQNEASWQNANKVAFFENFAFAQDFKQVTLNFLMQNKIKDSQLFNNDNIEIVGDGYNIKWIDTQTNSTREYLYNIDLINKSKGISLKLLAHLAVSNIDIYTQPNNSNELSNINKLDLNHVKVLNVYLDTNTTLQFDPSPSPLSPNHFEILNTMYLMEPYLTTGKSMSMSASMRNDFKTKLAQIVEK